MTQLGFTLIGMFVCMGCCFHPATVLAAEPAVVTITSPQSYQVFQRVGYVPTSLETNASNHKLGSAFVDVTGSIPAGVTATDWMFRLNPCDVGGVVASSSTASSEETGVPWEKISSRLELNDGTFQWRIVVPAGGWYTLEIRCRDADKNSVLSGRVAPLGVGEVFLVAGQSYATNTNDEQLKVTDPQRRVVAFDSATNRWAVADDPQPTPDKTDGGSIWPAVGDALVAEFDVPIAFANVAFGGTSSTQWLPEEGLHEQLRETGRLLSRFRAVLWQQGESDVILHTSAEQYVANLKRIRKSAARAWGFEPPWLLAKSTHHPTVYNDPEGEGRIRGAIEQLTDMPGFGLGPDTDVLQGDNRGGDNSRRHFSASGQQNAAVLWQRAIQAKLASIPLGVEAASFLLTDLKLREPAWASEIVTRESSIVLQTDTSELGVARLAFPAAEIIEVALADREFQLSLTNACSLADDFKVYFNPMVLQKEHELRGRMFRSIEPVAESELFPLPNTPNSYQHRVGHPEQNLLYRPGRWFHDRNVEITYRRDLLKEDLTSSNIIYGQLPLTTQCLQAGEPLTVGISGDSISTGLDASIMTLAPPFQPGYPELVVAQLQVDFDSHLTLKNRSVAGWSVANGVADLDALLAEKPQLVIVAYGMNDVGRRDPKWFADQTRTIIQRVQAANPKTEILLVATMLGNKEWIHTPRDMFALYRDELKGLVGPGVALADVTQIWELLLHRKHDLDLTGNGLNHPNDFGHRLYAQAILQLLK